VGIADFTEPLYNEPIARASRNPIDVARRSDHLDDVILQQAAIE
jgi:hypothetical protein